MMKQFKAALALLLFVAVQGASAAEYKPGEVIVKYKDDAIRVRSVMNSLYDTAGVTGIKRYKGVMNGLELLTLGQNIKVQDAIAALMKSNLVEYAQPNYIVSAYPYADAQCNLATRGDEDPPTMPGVPCIPGFEIPGCDPNAKMPCLIPGLPLPPGCEDAGGLPGGEKPKLEDPKPIGRAKKDPELAKAYGLTNIKATSVWKNVKFKGSKDFIVAVIDTGIDYNHEDLNFNVWRNPNPTNGDVTGYDFIHNDGLPYDDNGHGTHTSGTIGAVGMNGKGVSGVNQRISIMGLKFLSGGGSGTTADAIRAIDYAIEHGAKVLSNSWGGKGDEDNKALYDAIERAKAKGVLFVAAAGNDGTNNDGPDPAYPASFDNDNLISVAATDQNDKMAYFSNYGKKTTHVGAPGVDVYSLVPGNKYTAHSGTSMACPHVAGAAAMLWAKNPSWDYKKVKEVLMNTVDKVASLEGKTVTGGRINLLKAMRAKE